MGNYIWRAIESGKSDFRKGASGVSVGSEIVGRGAASLKIIEAQS